MGLLVLGCGLASCAPASGNTRPDEAPLVVELFTSQGCNSCPAADRLLAKLAHAGQLGGRKVAPLAFHVDYWNDLGWDDPFSRPAWTERQQAYARALGDPNYYTPELVVAGGASMVGSKLVRVSQAIAAAPRQIAITASATWTAKRVTIRATAPAGADVWVAVWEDGTRTAVKRGENAGKTLFGERVVRRLEHVAVAGHRGTIEIALDPAWQAVGAVAFAQRPDRKIIGSALLPH